MTNKEYLLNQGLNIEKLVPVQVQGAHKPKLSRAFVKVRARHYMPKWSWTIQNKT